MPPIVKKSPPSMDEWLREAKADALAPREGMYLVHNGVVRQTAKARARMRDEVAAPVTGMEFSFDADKVAAAVAETRKMQGIFHVRVWLNEGLLEVGGDIMNVLIGGDIRPNVIDALQFLVGTIKDECVSEVELRD
jgi:molybdopterin synthase catalytic subunit